MRGNHGPNAGRVLTGLKHLLERLHMTPPIATEAQRIGTLPPDLALATSAFVRSASRRAISGRWLASGANPVPHDRDRSPDGRNVSI